MMLAQKKVAETKEALAIAYQAAAAIDDKGPQVQCAARGGEGIRLQGAHCCVAWRVRRRCSRDAPGRAAHGPTRAPPPCANCQQGGAAVGAGPLMQVRALMNYAYILKSERKMASTQATYEEALVSGGCSGWEGIRAGWGYQGGWVEAAEVGPLTPAGEREPRGARAAKRALTLAAWPDTMLPGSPGACRRWRGARTAPATRCWRRSSTSCRPSWARAGAR